MKFKAVSQVRLVLALLSFLLPPAFAAGPVKNASAELDKTFGSYAGVLHHGRLGKDQLARLDFIPSQEAGYLTQLMAVLTLYFGDYQSTEYVSYHFDHVRFNALTKQLVFDQADQPVTLTTTRFADGKFVGHFRSAVFGDVGELELNQGFVAQPKRPLIQKLWGLYRGDCDTGYSNGDTYLQLITQRSSNDSAPNANPFGTYRILGDVAWQSPICLDAYCTAGKVNQGSYNFFTGDLRLLGTPNFVCKVDADTLVCNQTCKFKRVDDETAKPPVTTFPRAKPDFGSSAEPLPELQGEAGAISGEYVGYLHHEFLDTYQVGSLNIASYLVPSETDPSTSEFHLSAIASLYFGDRQSSEVLTYQFAERQYPNPITPPVFTFSRPEGHVDAILRVRQIGKGVVRGDWYSLLFGRVGTFEFRKAGLPEIQLSPQAKRMNPLSGTYDNEMFLLKVVVADLGVIPLHPYNPFQPLSFGGTIQSDATPPRLLTGGSYDFYTGAVSLELGPSTLTGQRDGKHLKLRRYTPSLVPTFLGGDDFDSYVFRN